MKLERKLATTTRRLIDIKSDDAKIVEHFNDGRNFTDVILRQINSEDLYGRWFDKKSHLKILDLGGNVGLFALHVIDCADQIVTVEPTPDHLYILKQLVEPYKNITVVEAALSPIDGDVSFYFNKENTTMNSIANNYGIGSIKVKGKTLKTILDENGLDIVDFAKIDIEGSEMLALTAETIAAVEKRIKVWFIEVHSTSVPIEKNRQLLAYLFRVAGYNVELVGHDSLHVWQ